jgi:hypothetical protein
MDVYAMMLDFAVAGIALAALAVFVWSWMAFMDDATPHPIYRQSTTSVIGERSRPQQSRSA